MSRPDKKDEIQGLKKASTEVVYPHIFPNADREVGGVLVGRSGKDGGLPKVTGAIEALSADEQRATLTFTQDSWEHVHREMDTCFPDDEIVGWYHSHPNFGIFLSDHDLFIHRNFFDGPSQIALVVDPCNCTEGVFIWNEAGDIEKMYERSTPSGWSAPETTTARARSLEGLSDAGADAAPKGELVQWVEANQIASYVATGIAGVVIGLLLASSVTGGDSTTYITPKQGHKGGSGQKHHSSSQKTRTSTTTKSSQSTSTTTTLTPNSTMTINPNLP